MILHDESQASFRVQTHWNPHAGNRFAVPRPGVRHGPAAEGRRPSGRQFPRQSREIPTPPSKRKSIGMSSRGNVFPVPQCRGAFSPPGAHALSAEGNWPVDGVAPATDHQTGHEQTATAPPGSGTASADGPEPVISKPVQSLTRCQRAGAASSVRHLARGRPGDGRRSRPRIDRLPTSPQVIRIHVRIRNKPSERPHNVRPRPHFSDAHEGRSTSDRCPGLRTNNPASTIGPVISVSAGHCPARNVLRPERVVECDGSRLFRGVRRIGPAGRPGWHASTRPTRGGPSL